MNPQIEKLYQIAQKESRSIIGLMSGTSVDGLDVALCKMQGSALDTQVQLLEFTTVGYDLHYKQHIKSVFSKRTVDLEKVCLLNGWIGEQHAAMILQCLQQWKVAPSEVDLIASHGQTIFHAPKLIHQNPEFSNATLQIGDGDHIAHRTGIITLSDFRQKHIAASGEGAPLAVFGDYLIFSSRDESRIMLNLGGIANFTYLPQSLDSSKVFSTDVGPGNTIMDAYIQKYFPGKYFDEDAALARRGKVHPALLQALKDNSFFDLPIPKTTGPELFNLDYLAQAQERSETLELKHADVLATLNRFSASVITEALKAYVPASESYTIYASGGGIHNGLLQENIKAQLSNVKIKSTESLGIDPDAKEAVLFAILANETLVGGNIRFGNNKLGIPSVTMGKVSFPN